MIPFHVYPIPVYQIGKYKKQRDSISIPDRIKYYNINGHLIQTQIS